MVEETGQDDEMQLLLCTPYSVLRKGSTFNNKRRKTQTSPGNSQGFTLSSVITTIAVTLLQYLCITLCLLLLVIVLCDLLDGSTEY